MRAEIKSKLADSDTIDTPAAKEDFLVYLMGPYKSYPPYETAPDRDGVPTDRPILDEILESTSNQPIEDVDEALQLLVTLKRDLRGTTGVNAFLATDPNIPLHEMDAATQSIQFTKAADLTVFIAPAMGENLGVGVESGSVCEHLHDTELREGVVFVSERDVESSLIEAISTRWHVTIDEFEGYAALDKTIRAHLLRAMS